MELLPFFFFALGAVVASFVGVLVGRFNTGSSVVSGRSRCDACGVTLSALDLIPVFSYVARGGRARCCGARVSLISTIAEVGLGALFVFAYLRFGLSFALLMLLLALASLLALVLYDLRHTIIPPAFLAAFALFASLFALAVAPNLVAFGVTVLAALLIGGTLLAIHFISGGRAMGFSDAPLAFALALLAGPGALSGFIFSFWIGAVVGIIVLARAPKGHRMGIEVPFAPFLAAGFLLALFTQWNAFTLVASLMYRIAGF